MNKYIAILLLAFSGSILADYLNCPCNVVKVSDGDTVHVLDQSKTRYKIRLGGIDAPEKKQAFGKKSTQNLANLVAGQNVEVEYDKLDRYGRIIGKLMKGGQDMNLQQIKDGFAWHYKYYQKDQSNSDRMLYSSAEIEARYKTIGLWSAPAIPPWSWRKGQRTSSTNVTGANFQCGSKRYCKEMTSCEEAKFYLRKCGLSRLDGDKDGVPCESICR